jgi:hypothetical protein
MSLYEKAPQVSALGLFLLLLARPKPAVHEGAGSAIRTKRSSGAKGADVNLGSCFVTFW